MPPKYKLTYFNARGGAEPARLLFAVAGVEYEDHRVSSEEWAAIKPDQPFRQIPVLRIDGKKTLPTSRAIYRYVAREYGLYGANSWESALVDIVVEVCDELIVVCLQTFQEKDPVRKEEGTKKIAELCPTTMANLEKYLKNSNNGDGWFVGDNLSFAEIMFWSLYDRLTVYIGLPENILDNFPKLKGLFDRIKNQKQIANWLATRPATQY